MYKNEPLVPWKQDEPHIYTRWWLCLYLWLYASEINYRTSKRTFFFARDLYQKRKRFGLLIKDGLSKTVPWNICSRRRKESVFLGHLKKRNIYTFYKVSTDRFHTRGQQLWFFFLSERGFYKRKEFNPQGTFFGTPIWPPFPHCCVHKYDRYEIYVKTIHTVTIASRMYCEWKAGLYICTPHLPALTTIEQYRFRNRLLNTVYWYVQEICSLAIGINNIYFTILSFKYLMQLYIIPWVDRTILVHYKLFWKRCCRSKAEQYCKYL